MSELLDFVLDAHGGLDAWQKVRRIEVRLTLGGYLFEIKGFPNGLRSALMVVDPRNPKTVVAPFPDRLRRGIFEPGTARIENDAGELLTELPDARASYAGHERTTPWNELQYLYFIGYAFWNYLTTPFLLARDGVTVREIEPWEEHGETWRVLRATFDPKIDTHCAEQSFYVDERGMIVRHDYFTDVARGNAGHYCYDHRKFDGFIFPTRRRVVTRGPDEKTRLNGPSSVWVELENVILELD